MDNMTINECQDYIYNLIKTNFLPARYAEDEDFDIYVKLLSNVIGESYYYQLNLPNLKDPDKCDSRFIYNLANNLGYYPDIDFSDENEDNIRLLTKYYLSLRRRRGTVKSLRDAVKFAGNDELSLLSTGEGVSVNIDELEGEGLFYIESSNFDLDTIADYLQHVKPAGTKWSYALLYDVPLIRSTLGGTSRPSTWVSIIIDEKQDDIMPVMLYDSSLNKDVALKYDEVMVNIEGSVISLTNVGGGGLVTSDSILVGVSGSSFGIDVSLPINIDESFPVNSDFINLGEGGLGTDSILVEASNFTSISSISSSDGIGVTVYDMDADSGVGIEAGSTVTNKVSKYGVSAYGVTRFGS